MTSPRGGGGVEGCDTRWMMLLVYSKGIPRFVPWHALLLDYQVDSVILLTLLAMRFKPVMYNMYLYIVRNNNFPLCTSWFQLKMKKKQVSASVSRDIKGNFSRFCSSFCKSIHHFAFLEYYQQATSTPIGKSNNEIVRRYQSSFTFTIALGESHLAVLFCSWYPSAKEYPCQHST